MADVTITTTDDGNEYAAGKHVLAWASDTIGYHFSENATEDLVYKKTTDGGATWGSPVTVRLDTALRKFSIWADWWTPGDTGNLIHIAYGASTFGVAHRSLDTTDDSLSTEVVIESFTDANTGSAHNLAILDIVKSRGGNLYVAWAFDATIGGNDTGFERSTDGGATWTARATPWESAVIDRILLQPGNEADSNDIWAIFIDVSADEIDLKVYDNSGDSWATTNIATAMNVNVFVATYSFDVTCRHSDNHSILIAMSDGDTATTDLRVWDIASSASITALTNVFTDETDHIGCAILIDQNTNDLYSFYGGITGEVFATALTVNYKLSTDGGTTWGTEVNYSETQGSHWEIYTDISVGVTKAGRVAAAFADTADSPDSIMFNAVNAISVLGGTVTPLTLSTSIIVDWDNDGVFDADEKIDAYVTSINWQRGKEPEQVATPGGNAVIQISDPTGIFSPNSTFWGVNGTVTINRGVRATFTYQGTDYTVFRGQIHRISNSVRPGNNQMATLFCVDETETLRMRTISHPDTAVTTAATPTEDRPETDKTFGGAGGAGTTGVIARILNEANWPSARRAIGEAGSTAEFWWAYQENAKSALEEIERHEGRRSTIFIDSSGDVTFYSSTHNNGTTFIAGFGSGSTGPFVQLLEAQLSARNVVNRSIATVFTREAQAFNSVLDVKFPRTSIATNTTLSWIVLLDDAPINGVVGIDAKKNSTAGMAIIGVTSGTSYEQSSHENLVRYQVLGGGSAIQYFVQNIDTGEYAGESLSIGHPSTDAGYGGSTDVFPQVYAELAPISFEATFSDPTSTGVYGSREVTAKYPFFGVQGKASVRAEKDVANNSTAHFDGFRLSLTGSDSNSVRQILERGIFDRIRVNSTQLHLKHVNVSNTTLDVGDFYITKGEWSMQEGGLMTAIWTLDEATKAPAP